MKKLIAIFFLLTYGFASVGFTLHTHYCMGKYVGTNIGYNKTDKCGKCGMKETTEKKGCCKDEQKTFQLKTDHQKGGFASFINFLATAITVTHVTNYGSSIHTLATKLNYCKYHPPPIIHQQSLHVLYCTFLI